MVKSGLQMPMFALVRFMHKLINSFSSSHISLSRNHQNISQVLMRFSTFSLSFFSPFFLSFFFFNQLRTIAIYTRSNTNRCLLFNGCFNLQNDAVRTSNSIFNLSVTKCFPVAMTVCFPSVEHTFFAIFFSVKILVTV